MRVKRYYLYLVCLTTLAIFSISISNHLYAIGSRHIVPAPWRNFNFTGNSFRLPMPLNYVPSNDEEEETVIRKGSGTLNSPIPPDKDNSKLILFYTTYEGADYIKRDWNWTTDGTFHYPDSVFNCPQRCKVTQKKSFAETAHAVVFYIQDILYRTKTGVPRHPKLETRNPNQVWVAHDWEPPWYHNTKSLERMGGMFNWTFTYRLDSDVYLPYGYFYKLDTPLEQITLPDHETLRRKKLAVTLISNCGAWSQRDIVIAEMKRYVEVDAFGGCGQGCPVPRSECRRYLGGLYKFFLAFENSLCQDYITEKFFEAIEVGMVPVTYGLGDYDEVAPPYSYINALDFPTAKALTEYLTHLDQNHDEYLEYFKWKHEYTLGPTEFAAHVCSLCLKLWEPVTFRQEITDFHDWWTHKRKPQIPSSGSTIGERLLLNSTKACVGSPEIFDQGYLGGLNVRG